LAVGAYAAYNFQFRHRRAMPLLASMLLAGGLCDRGSGCCSHPVVAHQGAFVPGSGPRWGGKVLRRLGFPAHQVGSPTTSPRASCERGQAPGLRACRSRPGGQSTFLAGLPRRLRACWPRKLVRGGHIGRDGLAIRDMDVARRGWIGIPPGLRQALGVSAVSSVQSVGGPPARWWGFVYLGLVGSRRGSRSTARFQLLFMVHHRRPGARFMGSFFGRRLHRAAADPASTSLLPALGAAGRPATFDHRAGLARGCS